jgi:serine/threonine protein kinase
MSIFDAPLVGQTLAHYRIESKLGDGGMGVVYRARDTHLDRFVALKVLPPEKTADPERRRRFVQEAKAASALNHPNIVTVHDTASAAGLDFIVMEWISGKTLGQLIGGKGLKLDAALKYATQIAEALAAAHATGIVHRDLKPGNVMVTGSGLVKVLDFGLAKLAEPDIREAESTRTMGPQTEEGVIVGTFAYMSPEQAHGQRVDARSDIFSFGSVLYEMITGRRAFQGETGLATLSAIADKEPRR